MRKGRERRRGQRGGGRKGKNERVPLNIYLWSKSPPLAQVMLTTYGKVYCQDSCTLATTKCFTSTEQLHLPRVFNWKYAAPTDQLQQRNVSLPVNSCISRGVWIENMQPPPTSYNNEMFHFQWTAASPEGFQLKMQLSCRSRTPKLKASKGCTARGWLRPYIRM